MSDPQIEIEAVCEVHHSSAGTTRIVVRFEGADHAVSIRPHLVRVIPR